MDGKHWYVVNTYSGHENKVKEKLEMRINSMNMQENIFRVIVPEQKEVEVKDGVTKEKIKKMFPGYVLVEMVMSDEAWYVVRNTPRWCRSPRRSARLGGSWSARGAPSRRAGAAARRSRRSRSN